jgi:hypothetical protein
MGSATKLESPRRMGFRLRNDEPDTMGSLEDSGSGVNSGSPARRDVPCRRQRAP